MLIVVVLYTYTYCTPVYSASCAYLAPGSRSFISPYMGRTHIWSITACIMLANMAAEPQEMPMKHKLIAS